MEVCGVLPPPRLTTDNKEHPHRAAGNEPNETYQHILDSVHLGSSDKQGPGPLPYCPAAMIARRADQKDVQRISNLLSQFTAQKEALTARAAAS